MLIQAQSETEPKSNLAEPLAGPRPRRLKVGASEYSQGYINKRLECPEIALASKNISIKIT